MSAPAILELPVRGAYRVAPTRSEARFRARGLFGHTVRGTIPIRSGSVTIRDGRAEVTAELDLAAVATGNRRRDKDLRSPRLLDVARFPSITYTGTFAQERSSVRGTLTVHGESVSTTLDVREVHRHPGGVDVVATTRVDRREFGVTAAPWVIQSYIDVELAVAFVPYED
ncbi:MAG: YceI family protein [Actinophytocola sp.]|uniref:YceI family protein n=1 Tax=Actinophytocola sp. TaxID=1872138 RepID=UPI003D6ADC49